jgi:hypothetical protein
MLQESLVRAAVVRHLAARDGELTAHHEIETQCALSFIWMPELAALQAEYEQQRDQSANLTAFFPRVITFFNTYAKGIDKKLADYTATRHKLISMTPANGATDVDPGLDRLTFVFDRPMKPGSYSFMGIGSTFPKVTSAPTLDEVGTTLSLAVKMEPGQSYGFSLNGFGQQQFPQHARRGPGTRNRKLQHDSK